MTGRPAAPAVVLAEADAEVAGRAPGAGARTDSAPRAATWGASPWRGPLTRFEERPDPAVRRLSAPVTSAAPPQERVSEPGRVRELGVSPGAPS